MARQLKNGDKSRTQGNVRNEKVLAAPKMPFARYLRESQSVSSTPIIFNLSNARSVEKLTQLFKSGSIHHVRDEYKEQLRELFAINNPPLVFGPTFNDEFGAYYTRCTAKKPEWQLGRWVFFPWISTLVHVLEDAEFQRVRTARNRPLITEEEQAKFYNATIGVAGLSIGNSVALAIILQGGARRIKLADFDRMDLSNLNRIRVGIDGLGIPKTHITARQIYLINPYAKVELFGEGLHEKNIEKFFEGIDLIIDEFDNFAIKRLIRDHAKRHKIPLVSGADVGESSVVDVERYDIDPHTAPFHGRVPDTPFNVLKGLDKKAIGGMIAQLVGLENHNTRMLQWPQYMGRPGGIVSFPQLGGTALLNGAVVAYCVYAILAGLPIKNGRGVISLETLFWDQTKVTSQMTAEHDEALAQLKQILKI